MSDDGRSLAFPGVLAIQHHYRLGEDEAFTFLAAVSATGSHRHLKITTFWEGPYGGPTRQLGGVQRDLRGDAELDVRVPARATMFIANMGTPPMSEIPNDLWAGWIVERSVAAVSPRRPAPMTFSLADDEQVLALPLAMGDRTMHVYTVRGSAGGPHTLWRHVFRDGTDGLPKVGSDALARLEGEPLFPVATPRVGEYGIRAVLGWLESTASGVVAVLAFVEGAAVNFVRSDPVPSLLPFPRQRLGLWKGGNEVELAAILQDPGAVPRYTRFVFHYAPDEEQPRRTVLQPHAFPAGHLRACALDYKKRAMTKAEPVDLALDTDGNLVTFDPAPRGVGWQTLDRGLPPDYPLPVVVSTFYFVADLGRDGKVNLWHFTDVH